MHMKNVLITGTTSGIGYETAVGLAQQNCHLFLANRSKEKTDVLIAHLKKVAPQSEVRFIPLDLSDLSSVQHAAEEFLSYQVPLDILINNAGILGKKGLTKDGYELAFGTNHLGHFLLTHLLRDVLSATPQSRIINVASNAHRSATFTSWDVLRTKASTFSAFSEYGFSKLANIWHINEIARLPEYQTITSYSLHPGVIKSDLWRHMPQPVGLLTSLPVLKTPKQGAQTTLFCALTNQVFPNGQYFSDSKPASLSSLAQNTSLQKELWDLSMEAISPYLK